jgi:hypothetical protein
MIEKIFYGTGFGRDRMSAARAAYLFLVWVLVPGWLVMRFYALLVGLVFTGSFAMLSQRMDADISFDKPFFTWTGDIGFEHLRVRPRDAGTGIPMSLDIRRVRFDMPNLGVMQSILTSAGAGNGSKEEAGMLAVVNKMDHVGIQLDGMKFDGFDKLPGILGYVGAATGAPLEAEGCVGDARWANSELPKLGISNEGIDLQLTLASAPEQREVHVTGSLVSPHSSRAEFAQHFRAATMAAFLDAPLGSRIATYERVAVDDEGFLAARDRFCAKRDQVDPEGFRERHIAAALRLFEAHGMRPTAEVERVYRQYLDQGRLVLEARPNGNIRREDYRHYSIEDQARMFNGTLAAKGKPVPVRFEEVAARPLPEHFQGSTWDLVAREQHATEAGDESIAAAPMAPVAAAPVKPAPVPAPTVAAAPAPAPVPVPTASARVNPVTPAATQAPAWALPQGSVRTTADGRPLASSLPAKGNAARTGPVTLSFADLSQHVGESVAITTIYGDHHFGRIEGVSGSVLRLRQSAGLGYAITNFDSSKIRLIRGMD